MCPLPASLSVLPSPPISSVSANVLYRRGHDVSHRDLEPAGDDTCNITIKALSSDTTLDIRQLLYNQLFPQFS